MHLRSLWPPPGPALGPHQERKARRGVKHPKDVGARVPRAARPPRVPAKSSSARGRLWNCGGGGVAGLQLGLPGPEQTREVAPHHQPKAAAGPGPSPGPAQVSAPGTVPLADLGASRWAGNLRPRQTAGPPNTDPPQAPGHLLARGLRGQLSSRHSQTLEAWRPQMRGQAGQGGWQVSSGAWAPAGRCSTADNGASPRASHPMEPQRPLRSCLLAPSPLGCRPPFRLPVWVLDTGHPSGSWAPGRAEAGHQDAGPACRAKALLSTPPEAGHVQALQGLKPQCLGLGSLSFSSVSGDAGPVSPPHVRTLFHRYAY
ncbi:unnamed protein product [Rangifer tarandus platyrhynchus]|uniref:Uncharacterized protein n=2 Tax=Rangifer tarandus platyrhynchus TaxID=3082113 RepID=A0ACB0E511_RANTA|nr:unnamed protein product [Rangifer tarandus platyrhynchus]CAI9695433.1 unnamed protein product [Rangifer tarandus platyrhynchus]